jgi:PTS system nitrogen regulatory IIA component
MSMQARSGASSQARSICPQETGPARIGCLSESALDNHAPFLAMDISLAAIVPHKEAAIALAADRLAEKAGMAYEDVKTALMGRGALRSTALGRGVAMPHAMARACSRPACALIGLATPVEFGAPDSIDVDVVLALIWPQSRIEDFIRLSSLTSRILLDPVVVDAVRSAIGPDRIRNLFRARSRAFRSTNPSCAHTAGHVDGLPRL